LGKITNNPVKGEDIGRFDDNCTTLGIPKILLMEGAGLQATREMIQKYDLDSKSKIIIFSGLGNNGGDGFVIARHLASRGYCVELVLLGNPLLIRTEEAKTNWEIIQNLPLNINIIKIKDSSQLESITSNLKNVNLIVDCMLGTGIKGTIREPIATAIDLVNKSQKSIVSIDVPSGMNPNSGEISDKAVKCEFLITFHKDKIGLTGIKNKVVAPIGIPIEAQLFVGEGDLKRAIIPRKKANHKGEYGRLLVIGGSDSFAGAPSLAAMAALELGIDLCICLVPKSKGNVVRNYSPHLIVREGVGDNLCLQDIELAKELVNWATAVVIGPGIGLSEDTHSFLKILLPWVNEHEKPCVIDADGIKILGKIQKDTNPILIKSNWIITPHLAELKALIEYNQIPAADEIIPKGDFLFDHLKSFGGTILVKGVIDYIIDSTQYRINLSGCPEMAVGGTGDVLAGLCGGLLSLNDNYFGCACSGAFLNGLLGEEAKKIHGKRIQALDLIAAIRPILHNLNI
jgi:ADP-dependent NAD(P)H-hydrate dehydratase / NAD(P)H-hydrate epimerase